MFPRLAKPRPHACSVDAPLTDAEPKPKPKPAVKRVVRPLPRVAAVVDEEKIEASPLVLLSSHTIFYPLPVLPLPRFPYPNYGDIGSSPNCAYGYGRTRAHVGPLGVCYAGGAHKYGPKTSTYHIRN